MSTEDEIPVRYSQMTEEQAAQQFEMRYLISSAQIQRKQMLMKDLKKQYSNKKSTDKPPRQSQSKQKISSSATQSEFVLDKQKKLEKKIQILSKIEPSSQKKKTYLKNIYGMIQNIEKESKTSWPSSILNKKINENSSEKKDSQNSTKKNENTYSLSPKAHETNSSEGQAQNLKQMAMKATLLSEIGYLDLEIKRMVSEKKKAKNILGTKKNNLEKSPYYEIRKKVEIGDFLNQSEKKSLKLNEVENGKQSGKKYVEPQQQKYGYANQNNRKAQLRNDSPAKSTIQFFNKSTNFELTKRFTKTSKTNETTQINLSKTIINKSLSQIKSDDILIYIQNLSLRFLIQFFYFIF